MPRDASRFEVSMGNASDPKADLDLFLVARSGALVGSSTNGGSQETITVDKPAPGYYLVYIAGVGVPSGSTEFDIQDTLFSDSLGSTTVEDDTPVVLKSGASLAVRGRMVPDTRPPSGRRLVGRFSLVTDDSTVIGSSDVLIGAVTQPKAEVTGSFGPASAFDLDDRGRIVGFKQTAGRFQPIRWDPAAGVTALDNAGAREGHALNASPEAGYAAGQLTLTEGGTRGGVRAPDGILTTLPLPAWESYTYDRAFAVNDEGTVVGNASGLITDPATGRRLTVNEGFRWTKDGGFTRLPHLGPQRDLTEPLAVNDAGVVVGHSRKDGRRHAVRRAPDGTVTDLGTLPGMADSVALAVNEAGWIVSTAELQPDATTAVVGDPQGRMYDLAAMIDAGRWVPTEGIGVNNRGEVAFYATDRSDGGSTKAVTARLPG